MSSLHENNQLSPLCARDEFHHVVKGDNPDVFRRLFDPAFNLAIWERAASEKIIAYFESIAYSPNAKTFHPEELFAEYNITGSKAAYEEDCESFQKMMQRCLPAGDGKQEAIEFLDHINRLVHSIFGGRVKAELRFNSPSQIVQRFHRDGGCYRGLLTLNSLPDWEGGDGSTRYLSNGEAHRGYQRKYDDYNDVIPYLNYDEHVSNSRVMGVGNLAFFKAEPLGIPAKIETDALTHAGPNFKPCRDEKTGLEKKRALYVISTQPRFI